MSENLTGGSAGITFVNDMISLIKDNWIVDNGGETPVISKLWETKEVGLADPSYRAILINVDTENPQIFSMLQGNDTTGVTSNYDWLHEISITVDVRTGHSETTVLEMAGEVLRILKTNVVPTINNNLYIQLLPEGMTIMNAEYSNIFRVLISVSSLRFNP